MRQLGRFMVLAGAMQLGFGVASAQAPPGPLPPPPSYKAPAGAPVPKKPELPARKNILGAWRINKDESEDGRAKLRQAREAANRNRGYGGPRTGGPWPGGGGYGGSRSEDESDGLGDLINPPREVMFIRHAENDPRVDLSDDRQHRCVFYTDGRKLEKQKTPGYQEVAAHWDGNKLVTEEKGAHNGKLSRTFEVTSDGRQLIESVRIADSKDKHPVTVEYVYDAADPSSLSFSSH